MSLHYIQWQWIPIVFSLERRVCYTKVLAPFSTAPRFPLIFSVIIRCSPFLRENYLFFHFPNWIYILLHLNFFLLFSLLIYKIQKENHVIHPYHPFGQLAPSHPCHLFWKPIQFPLRASFPGAWKWKEVFVWMSENPFIEWSYLIYSLSFSVVCNGMGVLNTSLGRRKCATGEMSTGWMERKSLAPVRNETMVPTIQMMEAPSTANQAKEILYKAKESSTSTTVLFLSNYREGLDRRLLKLPLTLILRCGRYRKVGGIHPEDGAVGDVRR